MKGCQEYAKADTGGPLHFARRRAAYYSFGGQAHGMFEVWNGALSLTFGSLVVWVAYRYVPEVREILRALPDIWNGVVRSVNL